MRLYEGHIGKIPGTALGAVIALVSLLFPVGAFAQQGFFSTKPGTVLKWEIHEGNGDLFGYCEETLLSMQGDTRDARIQYSYMFYDNAGNSVIGKDPFEFSVSIVSGEPRANVTNISKAIKSGDYMAVGDLSSIPPDITVGSTIPDSKIVVKLLNVFNNSNRYTRREVTGREQVRVKAGTFDCYLVEDWEYFSGSGPFRVQSWISRGVGLVRQVIYKKDGTVNQVFDLIEMKNNN